MGAYSQHLYHWVDPCQRSEKRKFRESWKIYPPRTWWTRDLELSKVLQSSVDAVREARSVVVRILWRKFSNGQSSNLGWGNSQFQESLPIAVLKISWSCKSMPAVKALQGDDHCTPASFRSQKIVSFGSRWSADQFERRLRARSSVPTRRCSTESRVGQSIPSL